MNSAALTVGLIGAGGITQVHLPAWLELGAEVTVYSLDGAEELATQYGVRAVPSLDALFEKCDIVDICTPTPTHRNFVEAALMAGKNVICEKPVALTVSDIEAIGTLAASVGLAVYPAHVVRFFPEYARAKAAVDAGEIGSPAVSRFTRMGAFPHWSAWFADDRMSGGIVMDQMIHDLDIARWISGEVTTVYAVKSMSAAEDQVSAQVVLTHDSGALSYITGVWGAPGTTFATCFSIAGSGGVLTHDSRSDGSLRVDLGLSTAAGGARPDTSLVESPYLSELREFVTAIRGGVPSRVTLLDGARAVEIAAAANESIATGQSIMVERASLASLSLVVAA
jgi:predicted dehydrogenase